MPYAREFVALQVRFAERMAAVCAMELADALFACTTLRSAFALGGSVDREHPVWHSYLRGLSCTADVVAWTFAFYQQRQRFVPPDTTTYYGCFSYAYWAEVKTVRIHFTDRDQSGMGALSSARRAARHAELQALVAAVVRQHPEAEHVRGGSWLYNLAAYRRLFPPAYLASAHVAPTHEEFPYLALWGQFLDRHGRVRAEPARRFPDCITHSQDRTALEACFPYQVLRPHCPLPVFQRFYDSTLSTP